MSNNIESAIKPFIGEREIAGQNPDIPLYLKWYKGHDPEFHIYKLFTAAKQSTITRTKKHLPTGKIICETWANLLFNEKTKFKMGENDKKLLDLIFKDNNFQKRGNSLIEKSFALSVGGFVVRVKNLQADEKGNIIGNEKGKIKIDCVDATKIYPITIESGEITECAFAISNTQSSAITIHLIDEVTGNYKITNLFFKDKDFKTLDDEKTVTFDTKSDVPWFSTIGPNVVNNEDMDLDMNISIFANQIDQMKSIDNKYDLFDNEFVHGRKKTYISTKLEQYNNDGDLINALEGCEEDVMFIPQGEDGRNLIQTDTSELRSSACVEALNSELSMLGYACGFGKGFLSFNSESSGRPIQTATASMMQNNDLFRSVHKHELVLEAALRKLVEAIVQASQFTKDKFSLNATDKLEIIFDDSIFEDKEAEKNSARTDIQNGIMSELEYRMKFYGEKEEDAKKKLLENPSYIAKQINSFTPALTQGTMTARQYVKAVWFDEDEKIIKEIEDMLNKNGEINEEDIKSLGFGDDA